MPACPGRALSSKDSALPSMGGIMLPRLSVLAGIALVLTAAASSAQEKVAPDLILEQEKQKQIQAETESLVRKIGSMLRVMEYYQIDKAGERKILEEVSVLLAGL